MELTLEEFEESLQDKTIAERLKIAASLEEKVTSIRSNIEPDIREHYKVLMQSMGRTGWSQSDYDRFQIEDDCIRFFSEQNTACHCHPEYETFEYTISFDDLVLTPEEFSEKLAGRNRAVAERKRIEAEQEALRKAEAARIAAEKARIQKLEDERKQYEALKQKFEGRVQS
jgi:hypothetical protein